MRMKPIPLILVLLLAVACGSDPVAPNWQDPNDADPEEPLDEEEEGNGEGDARDPVVEPRPLFRDLTASQNYGDIEISFVADWPSSVKMDVSLKYEGACNQDGFRPVLTRGSLTGLSGGSNAVTWHSWDEEAGCEGPISFELSVVAPLENVYFDIGEKSSKTFVDALYLRNVGVNSGFVTFPQYEQGVHPHQMDAYHEALDLLLDDPGTAFVATRMDDEYEVRGPGGWIRYVRRQTHKGYEYEIVDGYGENPIANQDPTAFNTLAEELARGSNPAGTAVPEHDYEADDPRLSFIEPEDDSYPFAFKRIAAFFDSPKAPNLYVSPKGYSHMASGHFGEHGSLNMSQSRAPLLLMGKGIKEGVILDEPIRSVDIAPTVAALLGFPRIKGVDHRGIKSAFNYLKWQDGQPIESILTGETASRAIIIISDGLNKTRFEHLLEENPSGMTAFRRMKAQGVHGIYGSINNWPSNTFPGHNVIGSGIFSGHHGVIDNYFYLRDSDIRVNFANQLVFGMFDSTYFDPIQPPGGETLHQAVKRTFGRWEPGSDEGAYTFSAFSPSGEDADTADLLAVDRSGKIFDWDTLEPPEGAPLPSISPLVSYRTFALQLTEGILMKQFKLLFETGPNPIPKFTIMNLMASDAAGHHKGPHHDIMRLVVENVNQNIELMFRWLAEWGLMEDTVFIFTADHGMQLGDPERASHPIDALEAATFDYQAGTKYSIYFR